MASPSSITTLEGWVEDSLPHTPQSIRDQVVQYLTYNGYHRAIESILSDFEPGYHDWKSYSNGMWGSLYRDHGKIVDEIVVGNLCFPSTTDTLPDMRPPESRSPYIDYKVVERGTPDALRRSVMESLRSGWILHGDPFTRDSKLCQGMVMPRPVAE